MKPFLFLGIRAEDAAADDEYAAVLRCAGLDERDLRRHRLERDELGHADLDAWSGIVLGGGPFNISDPAELKTPGQRRAEAEMRALALDVVASDSPFFGACYGIGTLGTLEGGLVDRTYGEPIGSVRVDLTDDGRKDPLFEGLPESFDVFLGHKEAVTVLPRGAVRLAGSERCPVQAFRLRSNVYATQFHPELDVESLCLRIDIYRHHGYFDPPEEAEELMRMARAAVVTEPPALLARFVELFARESYGVSAPEHVDVLIVGAGLSGIGAACRLSVEHPHRSVAILEARDASGGTWDVFRYPGIRSDSDMFTFGYRWRPWPEDRALADGPMILDYLRTVAREYAVDRLIRYRHRVVGASWDSAAARWTVEVDREGERVALTASFLWGCTGYYDTEQGYQPDFPGLDDFAGPVIHPQHWPEDLDHADRRVLVIGSGATAVTLVPAMAETAEHVTMLQRSPTYVLAVPARDPIARRLSRLPLRVRYPIVRWKQILLSLLVFQLSHRRPELVKRLIRKATLRQLPQGVDVDTHFKPLYNPWDQRLCLVPDGDLFRAMRHGRASVVTGTIETFTRAGVRLTNGDELAADLIVTATGLQLKPFGGLDLVVDGEKVSVADSMAYKALMLSGIPNFAYTIGYSNASWTLKADLVTDYVCRLLAHMDEHGHSSVVAEPDPDVAPTPFIPLRSGYVLRSAHLLPQQGDRDPWRLRQNYLYDVRTIRKHPIDDGVLSFT